MLKAKPPRQTKNVIKYPSPGKTLFAISCPLILETARTLHTFNCATKDIITEANITKANVAPISFVKTAVWVINPGPIADVAIKNAAPKRTDKLFFFSILTPHLII